jgi:hypothetical protein
MPPRGPLSLALADARRFLSLIEHDDELPSVIGKLKLAIQNSSETGVDLVTIVVKEEEADSFLDVLVPTDPLRAPIQKCLAVMRGHSQ